MSPLDMNEIVGSHDIVFMTLDTLRYDVASELFSSGRTPHLASLFTDGWQKRHTPGSFTYAAHHAFFAGFLPTPVDPSASQERLFATEFAGSETTGNFTKTFKEATIIAGLSAEGYRTECIGGVGFFNQQTELSKVFPKMFDDSHWSRNLGVTDPDSTKHQFQLAHQLCSQTSSPLFLFINISALHQPNCHYLGQQEDNIESHGAALEYVDSQIPLLLDALQQRARPTLLIACADHGTLYGEDGHTGHRVGHEHVYTVPYAHTLIE